MTVASLMNRLAATSALLDPLATSSSTSISRLVRVSSAGTRMRFTSRVATVGASTVSPRAAERIAGNRRSLGASLRRYPVAPASTARRMSASVS